MVGINMAEDFVCLEEWIASLFKKTLTTMNIKFYFEKDELIFKVQTLKMNLLCVAVSLQLNL